MQDGDNWIEMDVGLKSEKMKIELIIEEMNKRRGRKLKKKKNERDN